MNGTSDDTTEKVNKRYAAKAKWQKARIDRIQAGAASEKARETLERARAYEEKMETIYLDLNNPKEEI